MLEIQLQGSSVKGSFYTNHVSVFSLVAILSPTDKLNLCPNECTAGDWNAGITQALLQQEWSDQMPPTQPWSNHWRLLRAM